MQARPVRARTEPRRPRRTAGDPVRSVRAQYPRTAGTDAGRRGLRPRHRYHGDHRESVAARLCARAQFAVGAGAAGESAAAGGGSRAFRTHCDCQLGLRRRGIHRRRYRPGTSCRPGTARKQVEGLMARTAPAALRPSATHAPSYYAATLKEPVATEPFAGSTRADVCVVGGGYAGLATALHLARRGVDVVLLEQSRLGWGASGRNGGQAHVGMRRDQQWLERHVGPADARRLWEFALGARAHLDWLIDTYRIECDFRLGYLHANHRDRYTAETREHVEHLRSQYGYEHIRFVERDELLTMVATHGYYSGSFDARAGHLHALNFALGLARAALQHGARLHEAVEVTAVDAQTGGWRVATTRGEVSAKRVVLACNGYLRGLAPAVERHVMPINNYIAVTEPLGADGARRLISNGAAVSDSRFVVNYFRTTPDHRLLFGGGENYGYKFPRDIAAFVRPHLLKVFPQLAGTRYDFA